jgi:hypothetical protein
MNEKHFQTLADALFSERPDRQSPYYPEWAHTVYEIADVCALGNPPFDEGRFLEGCGVSDRESERTD